MAFISPYPSHGSSMWISAPAPSSAPGSANSSTSVGSSETWTRLRLRAVAGGAGGAARAEPGGSWPARGRAATRRPRSCRTPGRRSRGAGSGCASAVAPAAAEGSRRGRRRCRAEAATDQAAGGARGHASPSPRQREATASGAHADAHRQHDQLADHPGPITRRAENEPARRGFDRFAGWKHSGAASHIVGFAEGEDEVDLDPRSLIKGSLKLAERGVRRGLLRHAAGAQRGRRPRDAAHRWRRWGWPWSATACSGRSRPWVRSATATEPRSSTSAGELTYQELHENSNAIANAWREKGLEPGEGVAVLARNHRGFLEAVFAGAKCGARVILLNTSFAGPADP